MEMAQEKFKRVMRIFFLILVIFLLFSDFAFASSDYVLPYPSSMPGSILYKPRLLLEGLLKYWYFGNFGQFKYNLKESDKYLVEAKTLFEYSQFLNASLSLKKSDDYFKNTLPYLLKAEKEKKDIDQNKKILSSASAKHIEVLNKLLNELPRQVEWIPEKSASTTIYIEKQIKDSISIREKYL